MVQLLLNWIEMSLLHHKNSHKIHTKVTDHTEQKIYNEIYLKEQS